MGIGEKCQGFDVHNARHIITPGAKKGLTGDIISLNTNYLGLMREETACSGWGPGVWVAPGWRGALWVWLVALVV